MISREFQNAMHRTLLRLGWRVQRDGIAPRGWEPNRTYWDAAYVRRLGFAPGTLIDIGVASGTPELYAAFPKAQLVLIEPLTEFDDSIQAILQSRTGVHVHGAVGASAGEREITIDTQYPERSSFFARHVLEQSERASGKRTVPVRTLDSIMEAGGWAEPFGLKIDAEGAELEVLEGATDTLRKCEFVIAEVSVLPRFERGYTFAAFIGAMDRAGFSVCDALGIGRTQGADVTFIDLVFRRKPL